MEQKICAKIAENLDFLESSNVTRESTEPAVLGCSGVNLQEHTRGGVPL